MRRASSHYYEASVIGKKKKSATLTNRAANRNLAANRERTQRNLVKAQVKLVYCKLPLCKEAGAGTFC